MNKKNDNTMVKNASFLMVAALVSKIIGMLYKSPLSSTLGAESFALFQFAQNVYFILLMIASFSIPQAVSKVMAEKIAFKRYRDAQRAFYCALVYAVAAGGAVALFCVFGASILVPDDNANARLALQMLAPTIFMSGILGVFRGYFQAYRNMLPTSISQIIEQIFVAVVALIMSGVMIDHFRSQGEEAMQRWGAAGATMGTGAGVASALIFMLLVYGMNRKNIRRRIRHDRVSLNEDYRSLMKHIVLIIMPIILSAFIYNVNGYINSYMYIDIMGGKGLDKTVLNTLYAEYGFFMTLINIPLTLASTAPTSMIPEVSAQYAKGDIEMANAKVDQATWISMLISIPAAVGLGVLSGPVMRLIFPVSNGVGGQLLIIGAITVIPMIVYAVVMCVLNDRSMKKYMGYRNPWKKAYLPPLLASVPMAAVAGGVYYGLYYLIHINVICLGIAIILAVVTYFVVYLIAAKPEPEDLAGFPGGRTIWQIGRKLHLC